MVMVGEKHTQDGIVLEIREVIPYRNFSGKKELMIGYIIKNGKFTSPVAHFWMSEDEDASTKIREILNYYLQIKSSLSL